MPRVDVALSTGQRSYGLYPSKPLDLDLIQRCEVDVDLDDPQDWDWVQGETMAGFANSFR